MSGNATIFLRHEADDALPCEEAAVLLGVPARALARWSHEFAFPSDVGASGTARFPREQIETLAATLAEAHSVEGAIQQARQRLGHDG
ncbi:MAG: MerR family transcriptional regulator [Conexibacter sp.]